MRIYHEFAKCFMLIYPENEKSLDEMIHVIIKYLILNGYRNLLLTLTGFTAVIISQT